MHKTILLLILLLLFSSFPFFVLNSIEYRIFFRYYDCFWLQFIFILYSVFSDWTFSYIRIISIYYIYRVSLGRRSEYNCFIAELVCYPGRDVLWTGLFQWFEFESNFSIPHRYSLWEKLFTGAKKGLSEWMNELWVDAKRVRNESLGQCFRPCSPCDEARVRITLSFPSFCRSFHILIDDTLEKELAFPVSSVKRRALSPIIHSLDCTLSLSLWFS